MWWFGTTLKSLSSTFESGGRGLSAGEPARYRNRAVGQHPESCMTRGFTLQEPLKARARDGFVHNYR